jgi:ATP-dependent DNA helicase DinG
VTALLPSPFSYAEQALFLVAADLPLPDADGQEEAVADLLREAVTAAGGRSLILTTSWGSLRRLHERLAGPLAAAGITLRRQGEATRTDLLEALRSGAGEALLATDSFWEGIDVRGEALSLVAVTRLPFRVPSEPVLQARAEQLEQDGGNAFRELLLPMAVLKFKQGMGRLIRHRDDRGIALVLDPRIIHRSYGETFITSLGWGAPERVEAIEALHRIRAWFSAGERS